MSKSTELLFQKRASAAALEKQLLSAICVICTHTHRDTQVELDDRCETCPQIKLAKQAIYDNYALGYIQGLYDSMSSVSAAYDTMQQEINDQYKRRCPL